MQYRERDGSKCGEREKAKAWNQPINSSIAQTDEVVTVNNRLASIDLFPIREQEE